MAVVSEHFTIFRYVYLSPYAQYGCPQFNEENKREPESQDQLYE